MCARDPAMVTFITATDGTDTLLGRIFFFV
jgi:hypothetical protein